MYAETKDIKAEERLKLAQKYGYEISEITDDYLKESKDPKQTFYGLEPGWIIDLKDKVIFKIGNTKKQKISTSTNSNHNNTTNNNNINTN